ncbi:Patatin/Phospholipase A2-related protein [Acididesulfobacillus acetoxydans]|uniref:Patatin/Phospholipase A2-related protein n=1 Tax=Acididesulfobacillus acetoxydans TaxID=1561005 RepID=A0A8S0XAY1_9FIRM|nr:patatin-like phospholipase family protein [Acididesulfobacillus acetoxydans]CAA7600526.1 Patatin/Phospholipase A2-related protein [Acididesulfobacillus acetoxydans]CEJ06660.1 Protein teg [Acididesulfobacillus acetoxydans]
MGKYRILALDGGGIRGALTAVLLTRLQEEIPGLLDGVELLAGTSTGAIIALGLAYGVSPSALKDLYLEEGKRIFAPKHWGLCRPKYDAEGLHKALERVFPQDLSLQDLRVRVLVPAFSLNDVRTGTWRPAFFHNFPGSSTRQEKVLDVALASSAAPVYFPSHQGYIDGGVVAGNPSTAAIAEAIHEERGRQQLKDLCLLSLGTGVNPEKIVADTSRWGLLAWMFHRPPVLPLLEILLNGVGEVDDYMSAQLLKERYFRLNPRLSEPVALDDAGKIPGLIKRGRTENLGPVLNWLEDVWLD